MASTEKEKKAARDYYKKNKKYREEKIERQIKKQKANKPEENKYHREYYKDNEDYRAYKRKYAREYRKRNPIKAKSRKDRKAYK